jgi:hypothetical protein
MEWAMYVNPGLQVNVYNNNQDDVDGTKKSLLVCFV